MLLEEVPQNSYPSPVEAFCFNLLAVCFSNAHVSDKLTERKACKDLTISLHWFCAVLDPQDIISDPLSV